MREDRTFQGDSGVAGDRARVAGSRGFGRAWITCALPLFLAGCWDTEISDAINDALGVAKQVTASGYVVSDAAVVGATVEVRCLNGAEFRATLDLTGRYAVSVPREFGTTCSFMASGGTVSGAPNIDVYYGIASTRATPLGLGGEPILHLSALSTLGTAMAARMMPSVLHVGISTIKLNERARLDVDGERAAAGLLVLTQFDASRVGSDLDRAYASPHVEAGFAPVAGNPIAALLREWVRFERSRGLTLSDVTAVAARDGHVMTLLGSDGTTLSPLLPARAIENVPSDRSYCIRPGGRLVSFVNTCDEQLWVLICPSDSVTPAPVPEIGTRGDACRLRAPAMQPEGPGLVQSFRVQAATPFGIQFRQGEPVAPAGDALPLIVAACLDVTGPFEDVVPQFVSRPQTATDAFTFACHRIIN